MDPSQNENSERQELLREFDEALSDLARMKREYDALTPEQRQFVDDLMALPAEQSERLRRLLEPQEPAFEFHRKVRRAVDDGSLNEEQAARMTSLNDLQIIQGMRADALREKEDAET